MAEITSSTQKFIDIYDITNDLLILNDGSISQIIQIGAMNFGLLAEDEQDAAIYAYASILNSLNFPLQVVIKSQAKDITNYLNSLIDAEEREPNPTRKAQIARYRNFVKTLVSEGNVLDKSFYVVITASTVEMNIISAKTFLPWGETKFNLDDYDKSMLIERGKSILDPKRDHIIGQFGRLGLFARQLETQEIVKLFYNSYNSDATEGVEVIDSEEYSSPIVSANIIESQLRGN
ncbi:MAG: hypothetical protein LBG64_00075 [Pseudomonadales bacterium]|jgi:hypothetical protein|nr:hypothetical protein [Pseudomonadales bacterium]